MSSISSISSIDQIQQDQIQQQQIQQDQLNQSSNAQDDANAALVALMQNLTTLLDSLQDNSANGNTPPADVINQVKNS
jgi:peptidoglycan hydrolase CwlO-like protein